MAEQLGFAHATGLTSTKPCYNRTKINLESQVILDLWLWGPWSQFLRLGYLSSALGVCGIHGKLVRWKILSYFTIFVSQLLKQSESEFQWEHVQEMSLTVPRNSTKPACVASKTINHLALCIHNTKIEELIKYNEKHGTSADNSHEEHSGLVSGFYWPPHWRLHAGHLGPRETLTSSPCAFLSAGVTSCFLTWCDGRRTHGSNKTTSKWRRMSMQSAIWSIITQHMQMLNLSLWDWTFFLLSHRANADSTIALVRWGLFSWFSVTMLTSSGWKQPSSLTSISNTSLKFCSFHWGKLCVCINKIIIVCNVIHKQTHRHKHTFKIVFKC